MISPIILLMTSRIFLLLLSDLREWGEGSVMETDGCDLKMDGENLLICRSLKVDKKCAATRVTNIGDE